MDNKQSPPQEGQVKRYTIDEYLAMMEPVFQRQKAAVEKCVAGLTVHAAGLAAKGQEADVTELGRFISGMVQFWDSDTVEQHDAAFEQVVSAARDTGEAPALTEQGKEDILAGLVLYAEEMRVADSELEEWAADCDSLAEALEEQWRTEAASFNMEMGGM